MDHINKVEALAYHLVCLEICVKSEDVVMTLFEGLSPSYKSLITALETMPIIELTMEYMTMHFMHEMLKR